MSVREEVDKYENIEPASIGPATVELTKNLLDLERKLKEQSPGGIMVHSSDPDTIKARHMYRNGSPICLTFAAAHPLTFAVDHPFPVSHLIYTPECSVV
jgi:hypothetical protein